MLISGFDNRDVEEYIKNIQNQYGFEFPIEYKTFLLKYNGGKTPETRFRINNISSDLKGFYGVAKADQFYNYSFHSNRFIDCLKDGFVPIGNNTFGDFILIGIGENNSGKIFFYYHDRPKLYIELTQNFIQFTEKCKCYKIGKIRSIEERIEDMKALGKESKITPEKLKGWQDEIDSYVNLKQTDLII
ncbi:SMI1/KNR4 family protein [Flavobacterium panici]|uniref:Knr4/Smi1-like domain-containing protein n=1 Tax=Flavobacterium panici TaxID=2654843 RepID=A0A9N8J0T4_9FLAO|nr:SMI1/KNR4 family protein [Flavobacterium panici]CAC9973391.1 hypothetical protein FLAPXU55_01073 [Flavobacterium panici]